jgi:shikimate kinase
MMGSGKTTIGTLLAAQLGWPYYDNDELLARLRGESAKELLATEGVQELRAGEAAALSLGLREPPPSVVGAPAGTVMDEDARKALRERALVVWLTASPGTLARRARGAAHRPWLGGDAEAWMRTTLEERAPLYESVADVVVNTERRRPAAVASEIAAWVSERCP